MSIGTAIFLSSIVLGLIALYATTKDRWRWGLFAKRVALGLVSVFAITAFAWLGFYLWERFPMTAARQTEYSRIKIGTSPSEVNYIKGPPTIVYGEMSKDADWKGWQQIIEVKNIEKGKSVMDFSDWGWNEGKSRIDITFDPDRTKVIAIQCYSADKASRCPPIAGIADGSKEEEVLTRFGPPDEAKITGTTKRMSYQKLGAYFSLEQQTVYMLGINDPKWVHK
jgi:hypothetical protein